MMNNRTKNHIIKCVKRANINLSQNLESVLSPYENLVSQFGYKLKYSSFLFVSKNSLNANAAIPKTIVISTGWIVWLISHLSEEEVHNAFKITLGHEMTHKEKQFRNWAPIGKRSRFINHINEVHADFGGAQKMANSNQEILIQSIKYKQQFRKNDRSDSSHPSWSKRLEYAYMGKFNETLIRQIAKDVNYKNEKVIQKVSGFYKEIVLQ